MAQISDLLILPGADRVHSLATVPALVMRSEIMIPLSLGAFGRPCSVPCFVVTLHRAYAS